MTGNIIWYKPVALSDAGKVAVKKPLYIHPLSQPQKAYFCPLKSVIEVHEEHQEFLHHRTY